ncbi:NAD(P)/FAD-dependent oxidoreductase [Thermococcus waiotapuensis]|uniref:NAD(P)/FAD-dependent oxidoreductase n=1 Tax=Thermococcus waiotapuensis TaxID=90909 RepID=A0AAE4NVB7_9EURY|nr:NAD(P)/FAD-dependent oxidoreductase [Thermococcus waiotapuensis]MDV3103804.1 NAD(P)/FAD-dependent oxidoreductase [Thermococcus waiotapuensis]
MKYDVLIIGGGPVGNYLATLLARKLDVAVVEKKPSFGGKACTGIIGAESFEELGFPEEAVINELRGAVFYSKIQSFEIERKTPQAYVVDRKTLERELAKEAIKQGADYFMGTTFTGFRDGKARLQHLNEAFEIEADFYVGADGLASTVAREIGAKSEAEFLKGYEAEVVGNFRRDFTEVWINRELNPEFFFWVTPVSEEIARVGTFGELEVFRRFLTGRGLKPTSIVEFKAGSVGLGWRKPWVSGNVALVGDAALQIKPTTAGGIVFGAICAHHLARAIIEGDLGSYERSCSAIRDQISFGLRVRKVFKGLSQEGIEEIFKVLGSEDAVETIEEYADFDDHLRTFRALAKKPRLLAALLKISPSIIRALL